MKFFRFLLLLATISTFVFACGKDDDDTVDCTETYNGQVKAIIDSSCAYSGCHSGGDAGMFVPDGSKDYTTYAGLLDNLNNGSFTERTLDSLDMPPANFVPEGFPTELTQAELDILTCWIDNGFPEN